MSLKGTQTEKNILTAFCGESQARNRYTYFASKARNEGFVQIGDIFEETANQEKEHAKRLFKLLEGGEVADYRLLSRRRDRHDGGEPQRGGRRRKLRAHPNVSRFRSDRPDGRLAADCRLFSWRLPWRKNSTKSATWT